MLGPGFDFLILGLICATLGPVAAVLAGAPRSPAKASILGLAAYLLGLSAGSALGWYNSDLIALVLENITVSQMLEFGAPPEGF